MKSTAKKHKLGLRKETLVELKPDALAGVVGAGACWSIAVVCVCSAGNGQGSCITCK